MTRVTIIIGILFVSLLLPTHVFSKSAIAPESFGDALSIHASRPPLRFIKWTVFVRERALEEQRKALLSSLGLDKAPRTIQLRALQLRKFQ